MRRALPALIILSAAWALAVALTGGFDVTVSGLRLKSTDPDRPVYAATILVALYVYFFREDAQRRARALAPWAPAVGLLDKAALPIVAALSIAVFIAGVHQGVLVAEASDAWGYVSQADLWLARDLTVAEPVAGRMPWPNADWTFAPLGYRPALTAGAVVPTYPPGLPVLMAAAKSVFGTCGPFLIAPLLGGLTVWLTYLLGIRLSTRLTGLIAAALMATSPIFLLMVLSPLSDVPATAFLMLALVLALSLSRWRAFWTGAAVSMAIFIRPNLVFVGAVFLTFMIMRGRSFLPPEGGSHEAGRRFALGAAPLVLTIAILNTLLYGAPWNAGHGSLNELYSWRFIGRNLIDYPGWMLATETPFIVLAAVPLIVWRRAPMSRTTWALLVSFIAAVCLSYLFYRAYGLWLYLRFLLPIIPVLLVLAAWGCRLVIGRISSAGLRVAIGLLVFVAVFSLRIGVIRGEQVLGQWREGVPYTSVGEYVRRHLPQNAVVLTVQHSGSVRYYADRLTMRWDFLPAEWWPRAVNVLSEQGYRPYVLVTSVEEDAFRARFGLSNEPEAPGRLVATFDGTEVNRLYDPLRADSSAPASIPAVRSYPCGCLLR